jgi:hypothetical protein
LSFQESIAVTADALVGATAPASTALPPAKEKMHKAQSLPVHNIFPQSKASSSGMAPKMKAGLLMSDLAATDCCCVWERTQKLHSWKSDRNFMKSLSLFPVDHFWE